MNVLDDTLNYLCSPDGGVNARQIVLNFHFTVVRLANGDIGAAMSYYRCSERELKVLQERLDRQIEKGRGHGISISDLDSMVRGVASPLQTRLIAYSIRAALANALTVRLVRRGGDETFIVLDRLPEDPFEGSRSALVVGFGGYMECLFRHPHVTSIHVVDLDYRLCASRMKAYAGLYQSKVISFSDGHDTYKVLESEIPDVVCISGSTLCNGTLDSLVAAAKGSRIILQGQSAGIHPKYLFQQGVHLVVSTKKPSDLALLAAADVHGDNMKAILESGEPQVVFVPRD